MATPDAAAFIAVLRQQVGKPYVYGAAGPDAFDCSGLMLYGLTKIGIHGCPRTSESQYLWCHKITEQDLAPGDLIFEQWPGDSSPPGHVVAYIGGGQVIEAPETGQLVHIRSWSASETTIVGYGAVPGLASSGGSSSGASTSSGSSSGEESSVATGIVEFLTEVG